MSEILKRVRLDLAILARKSGVDYGYLRQLSARNQGAGPETRAKLVSGLEDHVAEVQGAIAELKREP